MEQGDVGIIFLYSGGRAPRDIVNARIQRSIDSIPDGAFCDCKALEYVELHDGVMTIGCGAFNGCHSLRRIIMPSVQVDGRSFNQILPVHSSKKTTEIQQWLESVRSKIEHHAIERNKLLREAARISCGANDIVIVEERNDTSSQMVIQGSNCGNESVSTVERSSCRDEDDEMDDSDPFNCYVDDIYKYLRSKESHISGIVDHPTYMDDQRHLNAGMRSILIDWLVEVHEKLDLVPETLYLNVNIVDRYLTMATVKRPKLQLVGVTALFIAAKYEEVYDACELEKMVYICDDAYTKSDILEMERQILQALRYQLTIPSPHIFLVTYLKADDADKGIAQLADFILDGTLLSYELLRYCPSELASAAILIARKTFGMNPWSCTLATYARYCEDEILPVARAVLAAKALINPELESLRKKYSRTRNGRVANIEIPSV